jgi:flagellar biosynthesis/type III secretory pathway chaperone
MDQVDRLCEVLNEEARLCGILTGVLRDEQQAVVELKPEAILACLEQRSLLAEQLADLATTRRDLVRAVGEARGAAPQRAIEVLPLLPPEPQTRLRTQLRALRNVLLEARGLERQNAILAGAGLDNVNDMLRALRALIPGTRYGADARMAVPDGSDRLSQRA